jgi:hypothetical protein
MATDLTALIYTDETAARENMEELRWRHGPVCSHCGVVDQATGLAGGARRRGLLDCRACRRQSSVMVGTVCERSHVPLHKRVSATHLISASKKGISAHQLGGNLLNIELWSFRHEQALRNGLCVGKHRRHRWKEWRVSVESRQHNARPPPCGRCRHCLVGAS